MRYDYTLHRKKKFNETPKKSAKCAFSMFQPKRISMVETKSNKGDVILNFKTNAHWLKCSLLSLLHVRLNCEICSKIPVILRRCKTSYWRMLYACAVNWYLSWKPIIIIIDCGWLSENKCSNLLCIQNYLRIQYLRKSRIKIDFSINNYFEVHFQKEFGVNVIVSRPTIQKGSVKYINHF